MTESSLFSDLCTKMMTCSVVGSEPQFCFITYFCNTQCLPLGGGKKKKQLQSAQNKTKKKTDKRKTGSITWHVA